MEGKRRGDLVTIAADGDYGKPRPAVAVQAEAFDALGSVTVPRLTSELHDWPTFRVTVQPSAENGLRRPSQAMIDQSIALPKARPGPVLGCLENSVKVTVNPTPPIFL